MEAHNEIPGQARDSKVVGQTSRMVRRVAKRKSIILNILPFFVIDVMSHRGSNFFYEQKNS